MAISEPNISVHSDVVPLFHLTNGSTLTYDVYMDGNSTTEIPSNSTVVPDVVQAEHFCKWILYREVGTTRVRIWDWLILVPNICFLLFLIYRSRLARQRLRATTSPIFVTFYTLVIINSVCSILRCLISMLVNAATDAGGTTDKVFWVFVRFFLLSTEISVLVFGLAFGHLDSRTSIRRVLVVTCMLALAYSLCQGTLELIAPDERYYVVKNQLRLYSHGGTIFWFITCLIIATIYLAVFSLPWTPFRRRIPLPSKKSFYVYVFTLSMLNLLQAIGSILFYEGVTEGLCIIDTTTYLYFSFFTPFVYWVFLSAFFSPAASVVMFSYKAQTDLDGLDDGMEGPSGVSVPTLGLGMPNSNSCSSIRTDASTDFLYQQPERNTRYSPAVASSSFSPEEMHQTS